MFWLQEFYFYLNYNHASGVKTTAQEACVASIWSKESGLFLDAGPLWNSLARSRF